MKPFTCTKFARPMLEEPSTRNTISAACTLLHLPWCWSHGEWTWKPLRMDLIPWYVVNMNKKKDCFAPWTPLVFLTFFKFCYVCSFVYSDVEIVLKRKTGDFIFSCHFYLFYPHHWTFFIKKDLFLLVQTQPIDDKKINKLHTARHLITYRAVPSIELNETSLRKKWFEGVFFFTLCFSRSHKRRQQQSESEIQAPHFHNLYTKKNTKKKKRKKLINQINSAFFNNNYFWTHQCWRYDFHSWLFSSPDLWVFISQSAIRW